MLLEFGSFEYWHLTGVAVQGSYPNVWIHYGFVPAAVDVTTAAKIRESYGPDAIPVVLPDPSEKLMTYIDWLPLPTQDSV